jgi:pimeloyl-ACP methyl ester carboxylesterase
LVHGSTAWGTDPVLGFAAQRPWPSIIACSWWIGAGYGRSPDIEHSDYEIDADDVVHFLRRPAHLVGHSYGAVVVMLAAARRPDLVRSRVLIEPGCYQVAAEDPIVAAALAANREGHAKLPADLAPACMLLKRLG